MPKSDEVGATPDRTDMSNVSRRMLLSSYMINTNQVPNQVDDEEDPQPETL